MSSKRSTSSKEPEKTPEKRTDKPGPEERQEPAAPATGRTFETDREGVHSATEGGIPDPSVQPGGGTVSDPIPGAPK